MDLGFMIGLTMVLVGGLMSLSGLLICCVSKGKTYTKQDMEKFLDFQIKQTKIEERRTRMENVFVPGKKSKERIMAS